jgi:SpoVK/Ycf46/Vps4 family AAA+-type ATPase
VHKYRNECTPLGITHQRINSLIGPEGDCVAPPSSWEEDAETIIGTLKNKNDAITWAQTFFASLEGVASQTEKPKQQTIASNMEAAVAGSASNTLAKRSVEVIYADLDALTGLQSVKKTVRAIVARQKARAVMQERGQPVVFSKHLVFTGAPGTGKTTVARYVGELYAAINVMPSNIFVEVNRSDLIAEYVGQTAPKVRKVVERARGGVLFIDEAYALAPNHASDYGHEALATLVQLMENHRDDLVVIMAGYHDEMQHLIDTNPGLRSRMTTYIEFPNYAANELTTIFKDIVSEHGLSVSEDTLAHVQSKLIDVTKQPDFGNARFVRSVWEHAFSHLALREFQDEKFEEHELRELVREDIDYAFTQLVKGAKEQPRRMGFQPGT